MAETENAATENRLPPHYAKLGSAEHAHAGAEPPPDDSAISNLRSRIEPWLCSLFQSEHLSLLVANGLTTAVCHAADAHSASMASDAFDTEWSERIEAAAKEASQKAGRGDTPNIEDRIGTVTKLLQGLRVMGEDEKATALKAELDIRIKSFLESVLSAEQSFRSQIAVTDDDLSHDATNLLVSFLLSFASRAGTRDRLNLFTTNYDRFLEYGCDQAGIRLLDRFVGTLQPIFRASRLNLDLHYNPPGIRGEPRYLEGVVRYTKLHGSLDWRADGLTISRCALPFGADSGHPSIPDNASDTAMIYPNPAKDIETLNYPYAELFRDFATAVCRPNSVLVTYGYGFGDDHVNRIIKDMLTMPSTHLVIISYDDPGERVSRFYRQFHTAAQVTPLLGNHFGDLTTLVRHYLPKPALDVITARRTALLQRRGESSGGAESGELRNDDESVEDVE